MMHLKQCRPEELCTVDGGGRQGKEAVVRLITQVHVYCVRETGRLVS